MFPGTDYSYNGRRKQSRRTGRGRKRGRKKIKKEDEDCDRNWKYFGRTGLCYRYYNIRKPWDEAKSLCMSSAPLSAKGDQKTTLASIPDRETNIFVSKLAPSTAWIGGYKEGSKWQWTDNTSWKFESWKLGQPDNGWPWTPGGEHYVGTNFKWSGKWNDWDKNGHTNWIFPIKGFICQYQKPTQTPPTCDLSKPKFPDFQIDESKLLMIFQK